MAKVERAIERMYGELNLTDELRDEEAQDLLKWGENELLRQDEATPDEETFDARFKGVRSLMKDVNRLVGRRGDSTEDDLRDRLQKFAAHAAELGYTVETPRLEAFLAQQKTLSNREAVQSMLELLQTDEAQAGAEEQTALNSDTQADLFSSTNAEGVDNGEE